MVSMVGNRKQGHVRSFLVVVGYVMIVLYSIAFIIMSLWMTHVELMGAQLSGCVIDELHVIYVIWNRGSGYKLRW